MNTINNINKLYSKAKIDKKFKQSLIDADVYDDVFEENIENANTFETRKAIAYTYMRFIIANFKKYNGN